MVGMDLSTSPGSHLAGVGENSRSRLPPFRRNQLPQLGAGHLAHVIWPAISSANLCQMASASLAGGTGPRTDRPQPKRSPRTGYRPSLRRAFSPAASDRARSDRPPWHPRVAAAGGGDPCPRQWPARPIAPRTAAATGFRDAKPPAAPAAAPDRPAPSALARRSPRSTSTGSPVKSSRRSFRSGTACT